MNKWWLKYYFYFILRVGWNEEKYNYMKIFVICMKKIRYMDIWLKINIFYKVFIENMLFVKLMRVIL